ncbi:succinyldiaminopimelate transaminase [Timonella sp. A28]|uniref:succinyldiaminopimelate transaminase n=1 Tax=Timonella sp. A28 TaxID=3442640 RepID=UPI003EBBD2FF
MGFADTSQLVFPWDVLTPLAQLARQHPDGIVDLSVGTPIDPTPQVIQSALTRAADAHGYPLTYGTSEVREAISAWFARRRHSVVDPRDVLPTVGSKELVGLLPSLLGLGEGDIVVHPDVAYPTYDVGARLAGATPFPASDVEQWQGNPNVKLVWINSPGNPHGGVLSVEQLQQIVAAARRLGALVVSDECYAELPWQEPYVSQGVPSVLDPRVCGDSYEGVLVTYSLSKQSNVAGYRAAFVAGDQSVVARLLEIRKHLGLIVPFPVQAAMTAAVQDDQHVSEQRARYAQRRGVLLRGLETAGLHVDESAAGLYLWVRADDAFESALTEQSRVLVENARSVLPGKCWSTVAFLAQLGILVAPGIFYGSAGGGHVRVALTADDERISTAAMRLESQARQKLSPFVTIT